MAVDNGAFGSPEKSQWTCPHCGAVAEKGIGPVAGAQSTGTVVCGQCGATFPEASIAGAGTGEVGPPAVARTGRNNLALVVVAIVAAGMLYFGFHMARRPGGSAPSIMGKSTPAPDFTLESLDGKNVSLSDLRGKAVLLNFWATWCNPCKIEMPWFVEFQNQYGAEGLQIVGVAMDDSGKDDIAKFAKDMGVNYPVLLGKEAVSDAYGGVPALPESFFIGRDGKIVDRIIGLRGRPDIEESIKKALDTRATGALQTTATVAVAKAQK